MDAAPASARHDAFDPAVRLWLALVLAGLTAGVVGVTMVWFVRAVEWVSFGHSISDGTGGVDGVSPWRRVIVPTVGAVVAGLVWWRLRPTPRGSLPSVQDAVTGHRLPWTTHLDAFAQLTAVSTGAPIGREAAPRQSAATLAQVIADRLQIAPVDQPIMVAAAAGAGLSAVYNVPVAGAVMAVEIMVRPDLRTIRGWVHVGQALLVSVLATAVARLLLGNHPTYHFAASTLPSRSLLGMAVGRPGVWWIALLVVVGCAVAGELVGRWWQAARRRSPATRALWWSVPLGAVVVGLISCWQPLVVGNGKPIVELMISAPTTTAFAAGIGLVKALATGFSFRSGAAGGQLTPALAVGAALGPALGRLLGIQDAATLATLALLGATAVLCVTQHAPIFAAAFVAELAWAPAGLTGVLVLAAGLAYVLQFSWQRVLARRSASGQVRPSTPK